jgi:hypothetical protein
VEREIPKLLGYTHRFNRSYLNAQHPIKGIPAILGIPLQKRVNPRNQGSLDFFGPGICFIPFHNDTLLGIKP